MRKYLYFEARTEDGDYPYKRAVINYWQTLYDETEGGSHMSESGDRSRDITTVSCASKHCNICAISLASV